MRANTEEFQRFAVYYAPPADSVLYKLGTRLLGWDAQNGVYLTPTEKPPLCAFITDSIKKPQKYGLHGTLKPPFRFRKNVGYEDFRKKLAHALADHNKFALPKFKVSRISSFCALTLVESSPALTALSATCVQSIDDLRAPPSESELERRRAVGLNEAQEKNLRLWGYPYVMSEFRFHITLTGSLPQPLLPKAQEALAEYMAPALSENCKLEDVCIFGEAADGQFHQIERIPLG